jgi:hypothetical protein
VVGREVDAALGGVGIGDVSQGWADDLGTPMIVSPAMS